MGDIESTEEDVYYADSTFFEVFTYKALEGSTEEALDQPNSIVLTETMAARYFSGAKAVGNTLKVGEDIYTVTAVIEDVPRNSHIWFDGLVSRNSLPAEIGNWGNSGSSLTCCSGRGRCKCVSGKDDRHV
jgi:putative ABC transport system permease protein